MRTNAALRLLCGVLLLGCALNASGLIFPLQKEPYDPTFNQISWETAWSWGDAIGTLHGAGGVAIAPKWIVTVNHVGRQNTVTQFNYKSKAYKIMEKVMVPNSSDLMLCRVEPALPDYAPLYKKKIEVGQIMRVYGQGHSAGNAIRDGRGKIVGWEKTNANYTLRWGLARVNKSWSSGAQWNFSDSDPEVGTNCAQGVFMDSGGGAFISNRLAGLMWTIGTSGFRTNATVQPRGNCSVGYLFTTNAAGFTRCMYDLPVATNDLAFTRIDTMSVYLPRIFQTISPPVRLDMGGTESVTNWVQWNGGHKNVRIQESLESSAETNAAPEAIYRSLVYAEDKGKERNEIVITANDLLRTEEYTVRLHFTAAKLPLPARMDVVINGIDRSINYNPLEAAGGENKSSTLEIDAVMPDSQNVITVRLRSYPGSAASLSGAEIILTDLAKAP